jgi:hypothetical protein
VWPLSRRQLILYKAIVLLQCGKAVHEKGHAEHEKETHSALTICQDLHQSAM